MFPLHTPALTTEPLPEAFAVDVLLGLTERARTLFEWEASRMDALSWAGRVSWGRPTLHVVAVSPKLSPDIQSLPFWMELIANGPPLAMDSVASGALGG